MFYYFHDLGYITQKKVTIEGSCCHNFFLKDPEFDPSLTNHVHSKIYGFFYMITENSKTKANMYSDLIFLLCFANAIALKAKSLE